MPGALAYVCTASTDVTVVGNYRGNWSPYIPRNLILRYTAPSDLVLDQMAGSGTTAVECKLLGRRAVGVDINPDAVMVARNRLDFSYAPLDGDYKVPDIRTYVGDARSLDLIEPESIDLIATHPPYASIIPYSHELPRSRVHPARGYHQAPVEDEEHKGEVVREEVRFLPDRA